MAIETIFYAKNVRSAVTLAHARGVALLTAAQSGLPVFEYSPTEIKSSVVGYGRAGKDQIVEMVRRLFQLPKNVATSRHDTADAMAVALCHLNAGKTNDKISAALLKSETSPRGKNSENRWRNL